MESVGYTHIEDAHLGTNDIRQVDKKSMNPRSMFGSGELSGKMFCERIIENR